MLGIENIIQALGYSDSDALYYSNSTGVGNNRHIYKLFRELDATAIYTIDDKPFILFLESAENRISEQLVKKTWNAQIPLMIISFDNRIEVYNGCSIDSNKNLILLEKMDIVSASLTSPFSFWNVTNSAFWHDYERKLSAPKLDAIMLDNIREATQKLKETQFAPFAIKIILRLLFIRYLIDRGVDLAYHSFNGKVEESQAYLLKIMQNKENLYDLFAYLKKSFNGNLFEIYSKDNISEIDLLDCNSLKILHDLMAGDLVLSSGQTSLFPMYDFNIIPIELISNIYERFLGAEKQIQDKAFYTPPYLVSYLLAQTVVPFLEKNTSCKILDPACGSGIFLVESARKLIECNMKQASGSFDDQELTDAVIKNLWGIDKNPDAIDVAIFSVYLTMLDYKDPKTLKNFRLPLLKNENFFESDFFSSKIEHLKEKQFDFIIGNPPWGNVDGLHVTYCEERDYPIYRNEISRSFVLRTKDFSTSDTLCCLIVTSKLFYNTMSPAVAFRKWLLEQTKISKYIELAPVREIIFTKARGPAGVVMYRFNESKEENGNNELCHLTLKPNIFFMLFNVIAIEKNDYKYVPQTLLLKNDWAWKTLVFGYTHDFHIIKSLRNYPTVSKIIKENKLKSETGITVGGKDKQDASHLIGKWMIDAETGIKAFDVIVKNGKEFEKRTVHRAKKDKQYLFNSPFVLVKKGFNTQNFKFRAAYSEENFLYTDAVTGICGKKADSEVLLSLTGLFNSSFYAYLNLMLGSSSGIEREQGFLTQKFEYPVIIDSHIAYLVKQIKSALEKEKEIFNNSEDSIGFIKDLDDFILDKFGLSSDVFVDYALNIQIPLVSQNKMSWEKVSIVQLREYAKVFIEYFLSVLPRSEKYISANIYNHIAVHYCAVEFIFQDTEPTELVTEYYAAKDAKMTVESKFMINKVNDLFCHIKDIIDFSNNSFYILKTNEHKNWHPAMAKLDLADVLDSILAGSEGHE